MAAGSSRGTLWSLLGVRYPVKGLAEEVLDSLADEVRVLDDVNELHEPIPSTHSRWRVKVQRRDVAADREHPEATEP